MGFVARRSEETRKYLFFFFVGLGATIALITVAIAQLSWRGWVQGLQALLRGEGLWRPSDRPDAPELRPIAGDLRALIRDLEAEHRSRDEEQLNWTPETLRGILRADLPGHEVMVVSNREPYIHHTTPRGVETRRDGWTVATRDGRWSAHFEHTVAVGPDGPEILSASPDE